jgi:hypothetical protein
MFIGRLEGNGTYLGTISAGSFDDAGKMLLERIKKVLDESKFSVKSSERCFSIKIKKPSDMWIAGRELECLGNIHADPPDLYTLKPMATIDKPGINITNAYYD